MKRTLLAPVLLTVLAALVVIVMVAQFLEWAKHGLQKALRVERV